MRQQIPAIQELFDQIDREIAMSVTDEYLQNNRAYAAGVSLAGSAAGLDLRAGRK